MAIVKSVVREMPDGSARSVFPFHLSLEGLEKAIICRDEEDYDLMVKYIFLCALSKNVIVVTYVVVSNHMHAILLSENIAGAVACGDEIRRRYAMWFSHKYHERKLYHDKCVDVQWLDTDYYLRNAIAYVFRNALDNGGNIESYPWSGYRAVFHDGKCKVWTRPVSSLTKREKEYVFHTNDNLSNVNWMINTDGQLEPVSCCDYQYVENAFDNSQAFFLKAIGSVNCAQMEQQLIDNPRIRMLDGEFFKHISMISDRWFSKPVSNLSLEQRMRLIPYIYRTTNTSIPQLSRGFGLERDTIEQILRRNR